MTLIVVWMAILVTQTLAQEVVIHPETSISTIGSRTIFRCFPRNPLNLIVDVQWSVNGTPLEELNVTSALSPHGVGILTFIDVIPSYNLSRIQCMAQLQYGSSGVVYSNIATLILQGTLSAVSSLNISLQDTFIHLTWTAPFTLNLTFSMVDILYCVDVINSTSSSVTLHSDCMINTTQYSFPLPPKSGCGRIVILVTPMNGAGLGAPNSVSFSQSLVTAPPHLLNTTTTFSPNSSSMVYEIMMTAPMCSVHMMLVDMHTQEELTLSQEDIHTQGSTVTFTSERLTLNRRYHVMITAANVNGSALSNIDEISTHDVSTASIEDDAQTLHVQYLENTRARGSLVLLMLTSSGKVDFSKSLYLALDRESSRDYTLSSPLSSAWYIFSVYDIEENGTVQGHIAYPAFSQNHFVMRNTQATPGQTVSAPGVDNCNVTSSQDLVISVLCTPSPESLATGYLVLVQRNILDNSQVSQLHVNESSGHTHAVTVVVEEGGDYHVTVFPMYEDTGIVGNSVAYSESLSLSREPAIVTDPEVKPNSIITIITGVGAAVGVLVVVAVIALLVMLCRKIKTINKRQSRKQLQPKGTTSPKGEAIVYEEIGEVVKETFMFTRNALYGVSSPTGVEGGQLQEEGDTTVSEVPQMRNQEYEDVDVPKSTGGGKVLEVSAAGEAYQMEECSAYGANN